MTGLRWNWAIIDWNECYNHRSWFGEDCSCHHCQISRGLPKERAPSHKQWPLSPRLSSLRPEKRPTFCWWNVQMHSIQRQCCILTKFMLVNKSTCNFSSTDMSLSKEQIYLRRHRVNANLIFNFSLMSDQAFAAWKPSFDFHTIHKKWPAAYTWYIHQNLSKLNDCIHFIFFFFLSKQTVITFTCIE